MTLHADGRLIVDRPWRWAGSAQRYRVDVDGRLAARVSNGHSAEMPLAEGVHTVRVRVGWLSGRTPCESIQIGARDTVWLRIEPSPTSGLLGALVRSWDVFWLVDACLRPLPRSARLQRWRWVAPVEALIVFLVALGVAFGFHGSVRWAAAYFVFWSVVIFGLSLRRLIKHARRSKQAFSTRQS